MFQPSASRPGVFHCTLTGAVVRGLLFLLFGPGAAIADIPASRRMVGLLTSEALGTPGAIGMGLAWAIAFGTLVGGLIAHFFNASGMMLGASRRGAPRA